MEHILVVDDSEANLKFAEQVLKPTYKVTLLTSAIQTMEFLMHDTPDLILLDTEVQGMNGFETVTTIKSIARLSQIPVIFLTSLNDYKNEIKCLRLGAVDFIAKPFIPELMLSRVKLHLELYSYKRNLESLVTEKTKRINNLQDTMVMGLAELVECRDGETGGHIKRTAKYLEILVTYMEEQGFRPDILTRNYVNDMIRSAPLHDIGKIGISDSVLLKNSSFDEKEREYMKQHTILGGKALQKLINSTNGESFLYVAKDMALCHHEKWDGTGYPNGLLKEEIPLCARIMSIADVYDALTSKRPYKQAFSHEKAVQIILDGKGTHFDPDIVDMFNSIAYKFDIISRSYNKLYSESYCEKGYN
ncbi:MAG: response regulator [Clostridium sp.]|nr:response regulator [Clostridium sp.]